MTTLIPAADFLTHVIDFDGSRHPALHLPWSVVEATLGREHYGTGRDDRAILAAITDLPTWAADEDNTLRHCNEDGWTIYNAAINAESCQP